MGDAAAPSKRTVDFNGNAIVFEKADGKWRAAALQAWRLLLGSEETREANLSAEERK